MIFRVPNRFSSNTNKNWIAVLSLVLWDQKCSDKYVFHFQCPLTECCSSPHWLPKNVTKFEEYFDNYVFGQHIVKNVVSKALRSHLKKTKSKKA